MNEILRKAVSYASNFMVFLMLEKSSNKIKSIYIFGSSVRSELDKDSDIDIFINCNKNDEKEIIKAVEIAERKFRMSKDFDKWRLLHFIYPFSIKSGPFDEWELKKSIAAEGIQLFSRNAFENENERSVLFIIDLPKNKPAYLSLTREIFGRKDENFLTKGFVEKQNGIKLGSNIIMVPKTAQTEFMSLFHKRKVNFRMIEVSQNE